MTQNDMPDSADLAPTPAPDGGALDWVKDRIGEITLAKVLGCGFEPDNSIFQKELDNLGMVKTALTAKQAPAPTQPNVTKQLVDACQKAAEIFRDYERIHLSKNPPDRAKAERNGEYAYVMEQAIAAAEKEGV